VGYLLAELIGEVSKNLFPIGESDFFPSVVGLVHKGQKTTLEITLHQSLKNISLGFGFTV